MKMFHMPCHIMPCRRLPAGWGDHAGAPTSVSSGCREVAVAAHHQPASEAKGIRGL